MAGKYSVIVQRFVTLIKSLPEGTLFGFPNPKTGEMYVKGTVNIADELGFPAGKDPNITGEWKSERTATQEFGYEASSGGRAEGNNNRRKTGRLSKFDGGNISRWGITWDDLKEAAYDKGFDSCFRKHYSKTRAGSPRITPVTWVRC
jgi:hypothetical protein